MAENLRQDLQMRQLQRMTPMQVQFVRMLEMTTPEIEEAVRHAVEENPALEASDSPSGDDDGHEDVASGADDYDDDYGDDASYKGRREFTPYSATEDESLADHLEKQLGELDLDPLTRRMASYMIGNIDSNGRLTRTLYEMTTDMAVNAGIDASREEMEKAYNLVRSLDPPGIGFIDLRDCLLLQLRRMPPSEDVENAVEIIAHYYDLYSNKRYERLRGALGLDPEAMRRAEQVILSLNPKPGAAYGDTGLDAAASVIVPDFNVEVEGDLITVSLTSSIPDLAIAESFRVAEGVRPTTGVRQRADERAFIKHHHDEAAMFIRLLKMRGDTMLRCMTAITRIQRDFFLTGDVERIRPMVLRDIADLTGFDLSVISRATSGKYVATAGGVYPLKMFFTEKTSADEEDGSIHRVLAALRDIIDKEDKNAPLSDEALKSRMSERGFELARRTVAKYREEKLGIPVARLRKKV